MAPEAHADQYGDTQVAIYIPSRYRNGSLIPTDLIEQKRLDVSAYLSGVFGGATGIEQGIGTFGHEDGRIIDETIVRVYAAVPSTALTDLEKKKSIFSFAAGIGTDLDQEAMAVEWGTELYGVSASGRRPSLRRAAFSALDPQTQDELVCLALRRIHRPEDLPLLLSLDGWAGEGPVAHPETPGLCCIGEKARRRAWTSSEELKADIRRRLLPYLSEKDIVFDTKEESVRVWMRLGGLLRGGRRLSSVAGDGSVSRSSILLALSLLGSRQADRLEEALDRAAVTRRFFADYRSLRNRLASELKKQEFSERESEHHAQVLLGRLMFLRFLEEKRWLNGQREYLASLFKSCRGNYYHRALEPLFFDLLDVAEGHRKKAAPVPFINGGLFRRHTSRSIALPNEFFDPSLPDSVLGTFRRYEFTLDESAGRADLVSVDPSMFGHVLESLCTESERKTKGVHYTPVVIARTLAFEAIVSRLAELANVEPMKLRDFVKNPGETQRITPAEAERISNAIHGLRILDPAVGSGSLLLAALNTLMTIKEACARRIGQPLLRGCHVWSEAVRKFVRESLFGVDIDSNAVEVAKLRLWLAISIWDKEPKPLPDLEHNIWIGDSLSEIERPEDISQIELNFDEVAQAKSAFLDRLFQYRKAEGEAARGAAEALEEAEREYVARRMETEGTSSAKKRAETIRKGGVVPFFWHIHFADIFRGGNAGFDVVIANPPYVSAQNLGYSFQDSMENYQERFASLRFGAKDIYLAFIEQGLALAGKSGRIAFINPNFSRTAAGEPLRRHLAQRGAVELWVDFGDMQIFEAAKNYTVLLFGNAKEAKRKTFECRRPGSDSWPPEMETDWISDSPGGRVHYDKIWRTLSQKERSRINKIEKNGVPMGSLKGLRIGVGVQTSADDVFLLRISEGGQKGLVNVYSDAAKKELPIEEGILKPCAKGSAHLQPYRFKHEMVLLWPYDEREGLMSAQKLASQYPKAWAYLKRCEKRLRGRESGKFDADEWWRFGRVQGRDFSVRPKLLVPSTMKGGMVYFDEKGTVSYTASGKGGGGAWGITVDEKKIHSRWLLAVLNSKTIWEWISLEGDPKLGGWRGVDKALLERIPVPVPKRDIQLKASKLTRRVEECPKGDDSEILSEIEEFVQEAFATDVSGK